MKENSEKSLNETIENQPKNKKEYRNIPLLGYFDNDGFGFLYRNKFIIFKSINDIYFLVCIGPNHTSITFYNIIDNKIMSIIHYPHEDFIYNLKYFFYEYRKMDLIMSIDDNEIKIWNLDLECVFRITNHGFKVSCFLQNSKELYIIAFFVTLSNPFLLYNVKKKIKIFDLERNIIGDLNYVLKDCVILESYFDKNIQKNFIIFYQKDELTISFDFSENKIYHKYINDDFAGCNDLAIINLKDKINLIELGKDQIIRLWDFHSGEFLKIIKLNTLGFKICIWDNESIFIGCNDGIIKLVNLNEGKIIKEIENEENKLIGSIEKINIPKYGDCLVTQDYSIFFTLIKLRIFENQINEKKV